MSKEERTGPKSLQVNDRVRRKNMQGPAGVVKDIRQEVTATSGGSAEDKGLLVTVQWDNGTYSYFDPNSLEVLD